MYSEPVQFSLFEDTKDSRDNERNSDDSEQLAFDFMTRGTGEQDNRDLQSMRV